MQMFAEKCPQVLARFFGGVFNPVRLNALNRATTKEV